MPMAQGYALIAGAMTMDGWLGFSGIAMSDGGFIGDEVRRMMKK